VRSGTKLKVNIGEVKSYTDKIVPEQFRHVGIAYWWGIVQERMFRLQPVVRSYILHSTQQMTYGTGKGAERGFPGVNAAALQALQQATHAGSVGMDSALMGGVHVRHGDKHVDGFAPHSFEAQLKALRASAQCLPAPGAGGAGGAGGVDKAAEVDWTNQCYARSPHTGRVELVPIFVASDSAQVLAKSSSMGLLVNMHGVSQTTQSAGMMATLGDKQELRYNATLEVVRDVYLLSRCSHLVGIAASQIFRMAVGMSAARGTLVAATAVDQKEIPRVAHLSAVYGLPFVESFAAPIDSK